MSAWVFVLAAGLTALPGKDAYFAAKEADRNGRHADALQHFEACAALEGPLEHYARIQAWVSRFRAGDREGAIQGLTRFLENGPYGPWTAFAEIQLAELNALMERHEAASKHYRAGLRSPVDFWWLDRIRWRAAENDVAHPAGRESGYAYFREVAKTTRFRAPRLEAAEHLAESSDPRNRLAAASAFLYSGRKNDAGRILRSLQHVPDDHPALMPQYATIQGRLHVDHGRYDEGYTTLVELAEAHPNAPWASEALFYAVRALTLVDRLESAETLCKRMSALYPDSEDTGEAWWRVGRAHEGAGNAREAIRVYERLASNHGEHDRAPDALMAAGRIHEDQGHRAQAVNVYDGFVERYSDDRAAPEAAYRAAVMLKEADDVDGHIRRFKKAVEVGLGSYYGHRAREHLHESGNGGDQPMTHLKADGQASFIRPIPLEADPPVDALDNLGGDVRFDRLAFFGAHGYDEAEWEVLHLAEAVQEAPDPALIYLAMGEAGVAYSAMQMANALNWGRHEGGAFTIERRRVSYPRAYWPHVLAIARETGVDPYLILAVARQESTYRPALTSHAGASGVMQLMPSTADWLADVDAGVDTQHAAHLESPLNSLRLGAYYLQRMIERSNGNLVFALASYNAGPGNCDKWRRRLPTDDMHAFIERIPFHETREYVKRVLGYYAAYHSLYPRVNLPNPLH